MRADHRIIGLFLFAIVLLSAQFVQAGMSAIVLTEYGVRRITGLSTALFFGLVVSSLLVRYFWGLLVKDTDWPKPTLLKSFAATFLGGLLFFLVLVMIAGSRELFSPGAWVPDGILYKLSSKTDLEPEPAVQDVAWARRIKIEMLRDHLKKLSESEAGLPKEIPLDASDDWIVPFSSGSLYEFYPEDGDGPWLAVEPKSVGEKRYGIDRKTFEIGEIPKEETEP